ncbi:prepilin-type N-terminal cleavage/methylation domain-containing protein [Candidatus Peregrinibacteria bacterium]|nr:prepilin-type N-terminal cleavage/methylation domain-containing protein [Candidatus Peregrinibacteria bacterium]
MKLKFRKLVERKSAFTLVELLIATTIFALFISVLAGSYLMITKAQRDTNEMRKVYSEGRFVVDEIVSALRGAEIDYSCYAQALVGEDSPCYGVNLNEMENELTGTILAVQNSEGKRIVFKADGCEEGGCVVLKKTIQKYSEFENMDNGVWQASLEDGYNLAVDNGWQVLTTSNVEVKKVYFKVRPALSTSHVPAYVTIYLSLAGASQLREEINFDVQTTISLRDY